MQLNTQNPEQNSGKNANQNLTPEEEELYNIFLDEYNDIFPKILLLNEKTIFSNLIKNVTLLLGKEKLSSYSKIQIAKIQSLLKSKHYIIDFLSMKKIREIILSTNTNNNKFPYLSLEEIIPHCDNTSKCFHTCGNELLKFNSFNYIICLNCKEIYKPNQIHLFCKECMEDYYSEIDDNNEEQIEDYLKATWEEYHCKNYYYYEDMKCPKCNDGLFFSKKRKILKCFNCKFKNKIINTKFKCNECGIEFNSNVKEYIKFENKPLRVAIKESLNNNIYAKPERIPCCNIDVRNVKFFIHEFNECNGQLLIGNLQGKKIVVCNLCREFIDYDKVLWFCPQCKKSFNITPSQPRFIEKKINSHGNDNNYNKINSNNFYNENPAENFTPNKKENLYININNDNNFNEINNPIIKKNNSILFHRIPNSNNINNNNKYPRPPISSNYYHQKFPSSHQQRIFDKRNSSNNFPREFNLSNIDDSYINKSINRIKTEHNNNIINVTNKNNNNILTETNNNNSYINDYNYQRNKNREKSAKNLTNLSSMFKNINLNLNVNIRINNFINNNNYQNEINKLINEKTIEPNDHFNQEDFIINKLVGEGTFGKIYSTTWIKNKQDYALKKIILPSMDEIETVKSEYDLTINFIKKTNCNGIIKIYGSQVQKLDEGNYGFFVLMELASIDWEQEIKKRAENKNYYTEGQLYDILKDLIKTFSQLQKYNIAHRDIKPQNILICNNNQYKICDFGEAKIINENIEENYMIRGTELYMSPILFYSLKKKKNQIKHNCFKSDVFSLGMCLLFAATLTFRSLYNIREVKDMESIKNILARFLVARYSMDFVNLILKMIEIDERKRPDFIQLENEIRD